MKPLDRVAQAPIPADLLKAAVEVIADLPDEERSDMTGRTLAIIQLLDEHVVLKGIERTTLLTGIQFRLEALARLHEEAAYKA